MCVIRGSRNSLNERTALCFVLILFLASNFRPDHTQQLSIFFRHATLSSARMNAQQKREIRIYYFYAAAFCVGSLNYALNIPHSLALNFLLLHRHVWNENKNKPTQAKKMQCD
jgi:hypothetical protein